MPDLKSNLLHVSINGKPVVCVGLKRPGNSSIILNMYSRGRRQGKQRLDLQTLSAGALEIDKKDTYYYLHYLESKALKVGDIVTIEIGKKGTVSAVQSLTKETKVKREARRKM